MHSFDIVSEHSNMVLQNVVLNLSRILSSRWDFRGQRYAASFSKENRKILLESESELHLQQMIDILREQMAKQGVEQSGLDFPKEFKHSGKVFNVELSLKEGIPKTLSKEISRFLKDTKLKINVQIAGEKLTVSSKDRDVLQTAIGSLKAKELERPLQFTNYK